ncbi:MAG: hypothetical protein JW919_06180 [Candidatus Omnitrophica bacterium]|nr:hypothetical protein [Candidatus Omnitrophota bacterium]
MKKYIGICGLIMLAMFVVGSIIPADCFSRQRYQRELTDNPKLDAANRLYKKAISWIRDGDSVPEPQRAVGFYANAESYLTKTVLKLKELGQKENIDVSKEVEFCEKLLRETHASQGMAKRASR